MEKQRATALSNSTILEQLCKELGVKLDKTALERLLYTQKVRGSSPLLPTIFPPPHSPTPPKFQ